MSKILTHVAYMGDPLVPTLRLSDNEDLSPLGKTLSLQFDTTQRFCIGWHDLATGKNHPCPDNTVTDKKYDMCVVCQKRTGFNPAFYHSTTVSPQQEARNAEPHHLYLAYMGGGYIKVGISWHKRGIRRLLDQGARAGLMLETFSTALIARQYEAKIARLSGIHETTSTRTKLALLGEPLGEELAREQLMATKQRIEEATGTTFSGAEVLLFDAHYSDGAFPTGKVTALSEPCISGTAKAVIGDILITSYDDRLLALPLKQFTGYPVEIRDTITPIDLAPQQMQLF